MLTEMRTPEVGDGTVEKRVDKRASGAKVSVSPIEVNMKSKDVWTRPRVSRAPSEEHSRHVLIGLIAVNVVVFVLWNSSGSSGLGFMVNHFLVSGLAVSEGRYWTLLTSAFSHNDTMHLLFNSIASWVFGGVVGRSDGAKAILQLYIAGALISGAGHVYWDSLTPGNVPALGASGAVMALAVVAAFRQPAQVLLINFLLPVPMALAVALYIGWDMMALFSGTENGIANAAHLGGAATGLAWALFGLGGAEQPQRGQRQ